MEQFEQNVHDIIVVETEINMRKLANICNDEPFSGDAKYKNY